MRIVNIPMSEIYPPAVPLRRVDRKTVDELAQVIRAEGIFSPIWVKPTTRSQSGVESNAWEVVNGRHRYEAMWRLQMNHAPCIVLHEKSVMRDLIAKIDTKLLSGGAGAAEFSHAVYMRRELYDIVNDVAPGVYLTTFLNECAKLHNLSSEHVRRGVKAGMSLGEGRLLSLVGTSWDKHSELRKLSLLPVDERVKVLNTLKPVPPVVEPKLDEQDVRFAAMKIYKQYGDRTPHLIRALREITSPAID